MSLFDEPKRERIISRINNLTPEATAAWGRLSVGEMLCHCTDGIKMATGERAVSDHSNLLFRTVLKVLLIHILPMPKEAPTADEINPTKTGTKPSDFEADRRQLLDAIARLCELPKDYAFANHAAFGRLSHRQWGLLMHKHIDHHLKQFGV